MRNHVRTFVNGRPHRVSGSLASTSVAEFLRSALRLTGTKNACNEGDCGACTVLVGRAQDDFCYQAINSCLHFVFQLDGAHVITIEGLTAQGQTALATALAEGHGVQCGFCTPGIVMAMTAAENASAHRTFPRTPAAIRSALAGNLCRCTGYAQIIEALGTTRAPETSLDELFPAESMLEEARQSSHDSILLESDDGSTIFLPATLEEGLQYLAENPDVDIVNGATDAGVHWNQTRTVPKKRLCLARILDLTKISIDPEYVTLGASASISRITKALEPLLPDFAQILERFGSTQIRNCATIGGNLASGSSVADCIPWLFAHGAEVELISVEGSRRMSVEDFAKGGKERTAIRVGEIISRISLPRPAAGSVQRFYKASKRRHVDIGTVTAAIVTELSAGMIRKARVAFGGVGPIVMRLRQAEATLEGSRYCSETFIRAAQVAARGAIPQDDLRGSARYRQLLISNLLERYYWDTCQALPTALLN